MSRKNIFRTLVVTTNFGYVLFALLSVYLDNGQFDAAYAAMPESPYFESYLSNTFLVAAVLAGIIGVSAISVVGLLLFKNWGRTLTVLGYIIGLPCIALLGPTIESGFESAISELLAVCSGIILASMYLKPISEEFNKA